MTQHNGIEISNEVLGMALQQSKIEAIRLLREGRNHPDDYDYIGLKDAKDAVEAAMYAYDGSLRHDLEMARASLDGYASANGRLAIDLANAQREVRLLRAAITDHIFGVAHLPDLSVDRYDDESPF